MCFSSVNISPPNFIDVTAQWEDIKDGFDQITCNLAYTQRLDSAIAIGCTHSMKK